jgi:hypothetical protein
MPKRILIGAAKLGVLTVGSLLLAALPSSTIADSGADERRFDKIEGVHNPEDLVRLGTTGWVISSNISVDASHAPPRAAGAGPLSAIDIHTRRVQPLYPVPDSAVDWDSATYPGCPAPPVPFAGIGLNVRPLGHKRFRLYAANLGERASVEVIDIRVLGERLQTTWRGCVKVPLDLGVWPNSVAWLPGGGIVVSGSNVAVWRPGQGWSRLAGFSAPAPGELASERYANGYANGVEVSRDGQFVFVADSLGKAIIYAPLDGRRSPTRVDLDFLPDNLRWGNNGFLYVTGPQVRPANNASECARDQSPQGKPGAPLGRVIAEIDPRRLVARNVFESETNSKFLRGSSTALKVGEDFWVGTAEGDYIVVIEFARRGAKKRAGRE